MTLLILSVSSFTHKQGEILEMKSKLTGRERTKWVFEKLEKTMGNRKNLSSQDCIYATLIFVSNGSTYFGNRCGASTESGKWVLTKKGLEEFTLTLNKVPGKVYDVDFYSKVFKGEQRRFLRMRIPGKNMQEPSLEYHYYAE
jgi:hypothetical protein